MKAKPVWFKKRFYPSISVARIENVLAAKGINTVCREAGCPNRGRVLSQWYGVLILGHICTRNCRFCAVATGDPVPLDPAEPVNIAGAVKEMELKYCVIISVTRDDLAVRKNRST